MRRYLSGKKMAAAGLALLMSCCFTLNAGAETVPIEPAVEEAVPIEPAVMETIVSARLLGGREFHDRILEIASETAVRTIKGTDSVPAPDAATVLLSQEGEVPVTAWFESGSGTLFYCSDADTLLLDADCSHLFEGFSRLTSLDTSLFDTTEVTTMHRMFAGCSSLAQLDLTSFETSRVTDMSMMFTDCTALEALDLSSFETSGTAVMYGMFNNCARLKSVNVSSFNTANVTDMNWMFHDCGMLTSLDLSSFDTSGVKTAKGMFSGCRSLKDLDLTSFDMSGAETIEQMFDGCDRLATLKVRDQKLLDEQLRTLQN